MNFEKENFDFEKMESFLEMLKTLKFAGTLVIMLVFLCKLKVVGHAKCWKKSNLHC